jgi:hypothetical protein
MSVQQQQPNDSTAADDAKIAAALTPYLRIALADLSLTGDDAGDLEVLPNGDVRKWIPLAEAGEKWINGPHEFDMTPELIDQGIANWRADGGNPIVVTIGHTWDAASPAAAWIEDLERRDDGRPWGLTRFLAETWARIEKGEFKYFSLEFYKNGTSRKGDAVGFQFDGGAILNKPFFPIRIDQSRHAGASPCFALSRLSPATTNAAPAGTEPGRGAADGNNGGSPMPDPNPNPTPATPPAPAPVVSGDKVTLSKAQFDGLVALQSENATLKLQNEQLKAEKQALDGRVGAIERRSNADRIRAAAAALQREGVILQLGDYDINATEAEALAWLGTHPFGVSTIEGLEKLAKDQEASAHLPRVKLGGERGAGGSTVQRVPEDLTTEAGRKAAVTNRVTELKRTYSKDGLEATLARRRQSLEEFAREDLAADHPQFRKQILATK